MSKYVEDNSNRFSSHLYGQHMHELDKIEKYTMFIKKELRGMIATDGIICAVLSSYKEMDDQIAEALAQTEYTISCLSCTAAHCCHQSVEICEAEANVIGLYCKQNNIPISKKYLQHQLRYGRANIAQQDCSACVFLKDNKCSIYPVRPSACRNYLVATPIHLCDTKNHKGSKVASLPITKAELIKYVLWQEGGKAGRLPKMLIKYSK